MNYKIKENSNGDKVLFINEKEAFCPYAQPIKVANSVGGFGIMRLPCQSGCPHFFFHKNEEDGNFGTVEITCSSNKKSIVAELEIAEKPKPSMIIK